MPTPPPPRPPYSFSEDVRDALEALARYREFLGANAGLLGALAHLDSVDLAHLAPDVAARLLPEGGLAVDPAPRSGSTSLVSSGGVHAALALKADAFELAPSVSALDARPVSSAAVAAALDALPAPSCDVDVADEVSDSDDRPVASSAVARAVAAVPPVVAAGYVSDSDDRPVSSAAVAQALRLKLDASAVSPAVDESDASPVSSAAVARAIAAIPPVVAAGYVSDSDDRPVSSAAVAQALRLKLDADVASFVSDSDDRPVSSAAVARSLAQKIDGPVARAAYESDDRPITSGAVRALADGMLPASAYLEPVAELVSSDHPPTASAVVQALQALSAEVAAASSTASSTAEVAAANAPISAVSPTSSRPVASFAVASALTALRYELSATPYVSAAETSRPPTSAAVRTALADAKTSYAVEASVVPSSLAPSSSAVAAALDAAAAAARAYADSRVSSLASPFRYVGTSFPPDPSNGAVVLSVPEGEHATHAYAWNSAEESWDDLGAFEPIPLVGLPTRAEFDSHVASRDAHWTADERVVLHALRDALLESDDLRTESSEGYGRPFVADGERMRWNAAAARWDAFESAMDSFEARAEAALAGFAVRFSPGDDGGGDEMDPDGELDSDGYFAGIADRRVTAFSGGRVRSASSWWVDCGSGQFGRPLHDVSVDGDGNAVFAVDSGDVDLDPLFGYTWFVAPHAGWSDGNSVPAGALYGAPAASLKFAVESVESLAEGVWTATGRLLDPLSSDPVSPALYTLASRDYPVSITVDGHVPSVVVANDVVDFQSGTPVGTQQMMDLVASPLETMPSVGDVVSVTLTIANTGLVAAPATLPRGFLPPPHPPRVDHGRGVQAQDFWLRVTDGSDASMGAPFDFSRFRVAAGADVLESVRRGVGFALHFQEVASESSDGAGVFAVSGGRGPGFRQLVADSVA